MGPVTIEFGDYGVRLSRQEGVQRVPETIAIVLNAAQAADVKAWFALYGGATAPTSPQTTGTVTIEVVDGVRLTQTEGGQSRSIVLTPAQATAVKTWFDLYGGATAPTSPSTINP